MSNLVAFVAEVEDAIASKDSVRRVDTLRRLTSLFVDSEPQLSEGHVEVFDEVILRLSRDMEQKARLELSERFSDLEKAPRKVVRSLAFDQDGAVARPILERSPRLDENDLVMIARARGQDHLMAISKRPTLSERVTDVLVVRGDQGVVRSVASNDGARFSEGGYTRLVERAAEDEVLQSTLETRQDVPRPQMAKLVEIARERVRRQLTHELGDDAAQAVEAALGAPSGPADPGEAMEAAVAAVARKASHGRLVEDDILQWLRAERIDEALAGLAHLAGVPVQIVVKAFRSPHQDPLLFIVRATKLGWTTYKALLTARAGRQPGTDVLRQAFDAYQKLSVQTAQRVVRFTAARERAVHSDAA